jgi:hypothetical protein
VFPTLCYQEDPTEQQSAGVGLYQGSDLLGTWPCVVFRKTTAFRGVQGSSCEGELHRLRQHIPQSKTTKVDVQHISSLGIFRRRLAVLRVVFGVPALRVGRVSWPTELGKARPHHAKYVTEAHSERVTIGEKSGHTARFELIICRSLFLSGLDL